jgi:hypothetical protein
MPNDSTPNHKCKKVQLPSTKIQLKKSQKISMFERADIAVIFHAYGITLLQLIRGVLVDNIECAVLKDTGY